MRLFAAIVLGGLALFGWPADASAGNDDEVLLGNQAALMGGAVGALVRDGSAAWYNPAGLGGLERDQFDASATVYTLRTYSAQGYLASIDGEQDDAAVSEFVSVPAQLAYERRVSPTLGVALAYFAPKSTNLLLRQQLTTGSPSDGSVWQLILTQAELQHRGVLALGYQASRGLRLGISLIGGYDTSTTSASLFGVVKEHDESQRVVSSFAISTFTRMSLELGLGMQWEATRRLQLGVFGRTPTLQLRRRGETTGSVAEGRPGPGGDDVLLGRAERAQPNEDVALIKAGKIGFGFALRLGDLSLLSGELDVQPGLKSETLAVSRDEVVNARLGFFHQIKGALGLGLGLFTDRASSPLELQDISSSGDFYGATLGVQLGERHFLDPLERVDSLLFSTYLALRYARSISQTTRVLVDPTPTAGEPVRTQLGEMHINEFSLYLGTGLAF